MSSQEWDEYFRAIDADGNGKISLDEMMMFFRKLWDETD
jgi:Ca2+-binding EF-hand superfamily protein